jgi:hypothetical protein
VIVPTINQSKEPKDRDRAWLLNLTILILIWKAGVQLRMHLGDCGGDISQVTKACKTKQKPGDFKSWNHLQI